MKYIIHDDETTGMRGGSVRVAVAAEMRASDHGVVTVQSRRT
jgi:hypothetical protein